MEGRGHRDEVKAVVPIMLSMTMTTVAPGGVVVMLRSLSGSHAHCEVSMPVSSDC